MKTLDLGNGKKATGRVNPAVPGPTKFSAEGGGYYESTTEPLILCQTG